MTVVYALLVAHFVGDFLLQSDWMASNKSKRWDALGAHIAAYSMPLLVAAVFASAHGNDALLAMWFAINLAAHFVQDAITSRINARLWQADARHWFFVGIGADQLLHYVTLFVTATWWLQ